MSDSRDTRPRSPHSKEPMDKSISSVQTSTKNKSDFGVTSELIQKWNLKNRSNKLNRMNDKQIAELYKNDVYLASNVKMQQSMVNQGINFKHLPVNKEPQNDTSDFQS